MSSQSVASPSTSISLSVISDRRTLTCGVLARHRQERTVAVAGPDCTIGKSSPREQLLRQRLDSIADLTRRIVDRVRINPQAPVSGIVGQLVRIVDEAEG